MKKKGRIIAAAGVVLGLASTGTAWSLWWVEGRAMSTGTATEARLEVAATPVSDLYPGGYRPATLTVRNPNPYPVQVNGFMAQGRSVDPDHASCPPSVVMLDPATASPSVVLLALGEQQFEVGVGLTQDAPQSCAGATFDIEYFAGGTVG